MPRVEHIPEPQDLSARESNGERVLWLLVACLVFGVSGNSIYIILSHGREAPIWCWLILISTLLGSVVLAAKLRIAKDGGEKGGWKGRLLFSKTAETGQLTLISPPDRVKLIEVRGATRGPLNLLIQKERGTHIRAKVQCGEHFGITGDAELTLRPDNRIALAIAFDDGTRMEEVFSRC